MSLDSDMSATLVGDPAIFAEIFPLSHELGELLNDPWSTTSRRITSSPAYSPAARQNNLEVGDLIETLPTPIAIAHCTARRVTLKRWTLSVVRGAPFHRTGLRVTTAFQTPPC